MALPEFEEVVDSIPGLTFDDSLDRFRPIKNWISSIIHRISGIRLKVAIMSSQKKKLYLNPSTTQELIRISVVNKTNDAANVE